MFLSKVNKVGKVAKVVSKVTGETFKVKMISKSVLTPKNDVFLISGKSVVWRDSIRRKYNVKD